MRYLALIPLLIAHTFYFSYGYAQVGYTQSDFEKCPFSQRSEGVENLIGESLSLLEQMDSNECQGMDSDVVKRLMARYQELMPPKQPGFRDSGSFGNNSFSRTRKFESDTCINYRMKYKLHFESAKSFIDSGLTLPPDNILSQNCYIGTPGQELSEDEKNELYSCIDRNLGSQLQQKEIKCKGEIDEELEVFYAESIMGVSQLLGNVIAGNCSGGNDTLLDSLLNIATEYVSLAAFSYPGLTTGAITNIIGPLFSKDSSPLENLIEARNMEKLQCMHHSLEKAKCKTTTPSYRDWIKANKSDRKNCFLEEFVGINVGILELAADISNLNLEKLSIADIQEQFDKIDKTNFFNKFQEVKAYIEEHANDSTLDRVIKLDDQFEKNKNTFDNILNTYLSYIEDKKNGMNKFQLGKRIKEKLQQLSPEEKLDLVPFFTLYADTRKSKILEYEKDTERLQMISKLRRFEGDRLASEITAPMAELVRQNDRNALKSTTAAFVEKTHDKFQKHLKRIVTNLRDDMKSFAKDKKFQKVEKDELFTSLGKAVMTCKLNASMYYYDSSDDTIDQMMANGKFSANYKKLCQNFNGCMSEPISDYKNDIGKFQNFVCSNNHSFSMESIKREFVETGKICGSTIEEIYQALK